MEYRAGAKLDFERAEPMVVFGLVGELLQSQCVRVRVQVSIKAFYSNNCSNGSSLNCLSFLEAGQRLRTA